MRFKQYIKESLNSEIAEITEQHDNEDILSYSFSIENKPIIVSFDKEPLDNYLALLESEDNEISTCEIDLKNILKTTDNQLTLNLVFEVDNKYYTTNDKSSTFVKTLFSTIKSIVLQVLEKYKSDPIILCFDSKGDSRTRLYNMFLLLAQRAGYHTHSCKWDDKTYYYIIDKQLIK